MRNPQTIKALSPFCALLVLLALPTTTWAGQIDWVTVVRTLIETVMQDREQDTGQPLQLLPQRTQANYEAERDHELGELMRYHEEHGFLRQTAAAPEHLTNEEIETRLVSLLLETGRYRVVTEDVQADIVIGDVRLMRKEQERRPLRTEMGAGGKHTVSFFKE